jgi:hypothetical protein
MSHTFLFRVRRDPNLKMEAAGSSEMLERIYQCAFTPQSTDQTSEGKANFKVTYLSTTVDVTTDLSTKTYFTRNCCF